LLAINDLALRIGDELGLGGAVGNEGINVHFKVLCLDKKKPALGGRVKQS
jgi:hypothetical protein